MWQELILVLKNSWTLYCSMLGYNLAGIGDSFIASHCYVIREHLVSSLPPFGLTKGWQSMEMWQ